MNKTQYVLEVYNDGCHIQHLDTFDFNNALQYYAVALGRGYRAELNRKTFDLYGNAIKTEQLKLTWK